MSAQRQPFDEIVEAGIEYGNHYSDLYIPATPQTAEILARYPLESRNATTFRNNITGTRWYDVPFAFLPYWRSRQSRSN